MEQASHDSEDRGRILRFRPRAPIRPPPPSESADVQSPVADLAKYMHHDEPDDYRHRMTMNVLAFALLVVLVGCGVWIVDAIAQLRKNQDCALTGRRNCAAVSVPLSER